MSINEYDVKFAREKAYDALVEAQRAPNDMEKEAIAKTALSHFRVLESCWLEKEVARMRRQHDRSNP